MAGNGKVSVIYADQDLDVCKRYVAALRERGYDVWYDNSPEIMMLDHGDTNVRPVSNLRHRVEIKMRSNCVLVLTTASSKWPSVKEDIVTLHTIGGPRRIIVVRIEACDVPPKLTGAPIVEAVTNAFDQTIEEVVRLLGTLPSVPTISIFVSYAHTYRAFVKHLASDLQDAGIVVWADDRLTPGTPDWEDAIRQAIVASNGVIYVASEDALASAYVRTELTIAYKKHIPIYPIWVQGDMWEDCAPFFLGPAQYADARGDKYSTAVQSIIVSVKKANSEP